MIQFESFTSATSQSNSSILNPSNENKTQQDSQRLTIQQVLEILNQQEELSTIITLKSSGYSGINFWNCSGNLAKIWYNDENDSRVWIKYGQIGSQSVCPRGPPQITLPFINGHTYDVVVSMSEMPGCSGDWPDDQECGKDFLNNLYGDSSQSKRPHYIYR